jgi:replication-associated recombination protein RarA
LIRLTLCARAVWPVALIGSAANPEPAKTTIAMLLASEVADPFCITELDAGQLTPAMVSQIEQEMTFYGWGGKGRAYIINEAHGLRKAAIRQLLVLLKRLPNHVAIIFTTTTEGQDMLFEDNEDTGPLLSRCVELRLSRRDLAKPFAERAKQIAESVGLDGQPLEKYVRLVQSCKNNLRTVLQEIEKGIMNQ